MLVMIEAGLAVKGRERLRIQGVHWRTLAHHALVQTQDPLRIAVHHAQIMRNQQQRRSTLHLDAMEERVDGLFETRVHGGRRFIEKQHTGFLQQR